jgi:NOGCT (NUC087) domain
MLHLSAFIICFAENWILAESSWKDDVIPEILDGKNIADFIDPDIAEKLEALEREEEKLQAEGFYDNEDIVRTTLIKALARPWPVSCFFSV